MTAKPWVCPDCRGTGYDTGGQGDCPCAAAFAEGRRAAFEEIGGEKLATAIPEMVEYVKWDAAEGCHEARALLASAGIEWREA